VNPKRLPVLTRYSLTLLAAGWISLVQAEVRMPGLFSDHMVLQQRKPIVVWD